MKLEQYRTHRRRNHGVKGGTSPLTFSSDVAHNVVFMRKYFTVDLLVLLE